LKANPVMGSMWTPRTPRRGFDGADKELVQNKINQDSNITSLTNLANWEDHREKKKSQRL